MTAHIHQAPQSLRATHPGCDASARLARMGAKVVGVALAIVLVVALWLPSLWNSSAFGASESLRR